MKNLYLILLLLSFQSFGQWNVNGNNWSTGTLTVGAIKSTANYGLEIEPVSGGAIIRRGNPGILVISSGGGTTDIRFNYNYGGGSGGVSVYDGGTSNFANFKVSSGGYLNIISSGGRVGIGTASPDSELTVKGDIHAEEVKVDLNVPGPDYVFEKDYNLLSLSEVESYINEHKHLPEVPSAKEMEANGLNLKEMNLLLLKKVEELTLHLIRQQEEIEQLKSVIHEKH